MDALPRSNVASTVTPLDPMQFGSGASPTPQDTPAPALANSSGQASAAGILDVHDRAILASLLALLRSARAEMAGSDSDGRKRANAQLIMIVCQITGYLDGRGALERSAAAPGFAGLFDTDTRPSVDDALDDLESSLAALLVEVDTRGGLKTVLSAVGDALIGIGSGLITASIVA